MALRFDHEFLHLRLDISFFHTLLDNFFTLHSVLVSFSMTFPFQQTTNCMVPRYRTTADSSATLGLSRRRRVVIRLSLRSVRERHVRKSQRLVAVFVVDQHIR